MNRSLNSNYYPHQYGLENNSSFVYFKIPTSHPLYGIVLEFYQFDFHNSKNNEVTVLPDACTDIMFYYTNNLLKTYVIGSFPTIAKIKFIENSTVFGMRFVPGMLGNLCKIPIKSFLTQQINCCDIITNSDELVSDMECLTNFNERILACEKYFIKLLNDIYQSPILCNYCVNTIINNYGNQSINELSEKTGYSERYIRKMFDNYVGVSPKMLCEIVKFHNSFKTLFYDSNKPLSQIAWDSGYYDLQHMNKSYKKFTNNLPKELYSIFFECDLIS